MKSQGTLLKELRKKYNLTQHEVAGSDMDRSMLAHIENDSTKYKLSEETAKVIEQNINSIIMPRYNESINYLYFYDNKKYTVYIEAQEILKNLYDLYSQNLDQQFEKELHHLNSIFLKYDLPELKAKALLLSADNSFNHGSYHKAYLQLLRAADNSLKLERSYIKITILIRLTKVLYYLDECDEAISISSYIEDKYFKFLIDSDKFLLFYNKGHAYKRQKNYIKALSEFDSARKYINFVNRLQQTEFCLSEAICYSHRELYDDALEILHNFLNLLDESNTKEKSLIYFNIIDIYTSLGKKDQVKYYIDQIITMLKNISKTPYDKYIPNIYLELANGYRFINDLESAEYFFLKSMNESKHRSDINSIVKIMIDVLEFYKSTDNHKKITLITEDVFDILNSSTNKINNKNLLRLFQFYANSGFIEISNNLLNLINKREE
jgi:tetratricopeptide (TPR) repeat protein